MKVLSKIDKLFQRDETLKQRIFLTGFVVFLVTHLGRILYISLELLFKYQTFAAMKGQLEVVLTNLAFLAFSIYFITVAKVRHFNKRLALILTGIITVVFGISSYSIGLPLFWFILILIGIFFMMYYLLKAIVQQFAKDLPAINPTAIDEE